MLNCFRSYSFSIIGVKIETWRKDTRRQILTGFDAE